MRGKEYWRSLEERADSAEFREFLEQEISSNPSQWLDQPNRREFLKLMGASVALAGLTGCRWPKETILPYTSLPDGRLPGVPLHFATCDELGGVARGYLATSYDGRPIKLEGNPNHPSSRGATDVYGQAALLEMYDPDRSQAVVRREGRELHSATWAEFETWASTRFSSLRASGGAGLAFLSEATSSPTYVRLRDRARELFPHAKWCEFEPLSRDHEREGAQMAFGRPLRTQLRLDRAEVVVSFDADFLSTHPAALGYARDFVMHRNPDLGEMSRLYVVESSYSLTGGAADHRLAVAPSKISRLVIAVAGALQRRGIDVSCGNPTLRSLLESGHGEHVEFADAAAADLAGRPGKGLVAVGPRQAAWVHALGHAMNQALGNVGHSLVYTDDLDPLRPSHFESIRALTASLDSGDVTTLVVLGGNPVYDAPADLAFAEKMKKADERIHLSLFENETSELSTWHVPRAHALESWGDAYAWDGTLCTQQPLIEPLYGGRTPIELLARLMDEPHPAGYALVRETLRGERSEAEFEPAWRAMLHAGVLAGSTWPAVTTSVSVDAIVTSWENQHVGGEGLEVEFAGDASVYDGRFANNGWLQEMPDPLTKVTWDNCALIAPKTADSMGIKTGQLVQVSLGGRAVEIVAYAMPGQAADTVTLPLGYGRVAAGRVGNGVGFDTYKVRSSSSPYFATGAAIEATGKKYRLASVQDHHLIDRVGKEERAHRLHELVREGSLAEYKAHPEFAQHMGPHYEEAPLWDAHSYDGHKWGLSIDLNSCIGCNACMVACVAENNIPVVGKDQIARGREMHWIRIDRYFVGSDDAPALAYQPVTCQQCENAPCEQVCPVAATVHSHEGLNDQVYNRCIGTRYCSNNCPYKVRRFNFYHYQSNRTPVEKMHFNPEVTVRARGVMEKCTYCIQRINAVKIRAKNEQRAILDGEITTACAQVCPTRAITFGDLNDPESRVRKTQDHGRAYAMLAELHVRPRTKYLARLRNPGGNGASAGHGGDEHHG